MEQTEEKQGRKIYRWIFLVVIILSSVVSFVLIKPVRPHIQLPAENLVGPIFGSVESGFYLTNTLVATLIADLILILIALGIRRGIKRGDTVLGGISGAVATILEGLYGMTESTAGKWARKIFPYFATIFLLVLVVNWMELIPGVDSIGILHHDDHGVEVKQILPGIKTLVAGEDGHGDLYGLIPFVRVASTDLNFTIALALSSVFMTQVIGIQALGGSYFKKYFNFDTVMLASRKKRFGNPLDFIGALIDVVVGILEIVAEFAKIISFSFRLFGNIFAGSVMLFVLGTMVPVFIQSALLMLEMFVGAIQAFVFGMLTMVFMSQATAGHGHDEHHEEAHA